MIEEYLDGPQYLVEAVVYQRQPHVIGIIEQEITQGKRFIITGYGVLVKALKTSNQASRRYSIPS